MAKRVNYWQDLEPDIIYHIYNRAVGKENIFSKQENYVYFLQKWKTLLPYLDVYAYCLMPNHFHFLVRVKPLDEALRQHAHKQMTRKSESLLNGILSYSDYLEDQFKRLFSSYALAYNKQEGRNGTLFQKRFKRVAVSEGYKQQYLLAYIHHNPLHHRFCKSYEEWRYSSWKAYIQLHKPSLLNRVAVLAWFSEENGLATKSFLRYHQDFRLDRDIDLETFDH